MVLFKEDDAVWKLIPEVSFDVARVHGATWIREGVGGSDQLSLSASIIEQLGCIPPVEIAFAITEDEQNAKINPKGTWNEAIEAAAQVCSQGADAVRALKR
jgi:hypothetical protein